MGNPEGGKDGATSGADLLREYIGILAPGTTLDPAGLAGQFALTPDYVRDLLYRLKNSFVCQPEPGQFARMALELPVAPPGEVRRSLMFGDPNPDSSGKARHSKRHKSPSS